MIRPRKQIDQCPSKPLRRDIRHFLLKRRIEDTILKEAKIDENRECHIKFRIDFLDLVEQKYEIADPLTQVEI